MDKVELYITWACLVLMLICCPIVSSADNAKRGECCRRMIDAINSRQFEHVDKILRDSTDCLRGIQYRDLSADVVADIISYYSDKDIKSVGKNGLQHYKFIIWDNLLYNKHDSVVAIMMYKEMCRIAVASFGEGSEEHISQLNSMAGYYLNGNNQYDKGLPIYEEIIRLCKKYGKDNTKQYAEIMCNLSVVCYNKGYYSLADHYIETARQVYAKHGVVDTYVTELSHYIAAALGNEQQSEQELVSRREILRSHLGENESWCADMLMQMANDDLKQGDISKYWETVRMAEESRIKAFESHYYDYVSASLDLAEYYTARMRKDKACGIIRELDSLVHRVKLTRNSNLYYRMVMIAKSYIKAEKYDNARNLLDEAVGLVENPDKLLCFAYGDLFMSLQQWSEAEKYYLIAYEKEKQSDKKKYESWDKLSRLYMAMGDKEKAQYYLNLNNDYHSLAITAENEGNQSFAEENWVKYVDNVKERWGEQHPVYASALVDLANYYYRHWKIIEAIELYEIVLDKRRQEYLSATDYLSEQQRAYFWQKYQDDILTVYPTACRQMYETGKLFDLQLFTKGLLLQSTNQIIKSIIESDDYILKADYQRLLSLRSEIERQKTLKNTAERVKIMKREAEVLEKSIVSRSAQYRDVEAATSVKWQDVQKALPKDAIAVEFVETGDNGNKIYEMLVLHSSFRAPLLRCWLTEKDLREILKKNPNQIYTYGEISKKLYLHLCAPILSKLRGEIARKRIKKIYISSVGLLNQIAFEAIPIDEKHRFSDKYEVIRVTSTREIVFNHRVDSKENATIYGGVEYDLSNDVLLAESRKYDESVLLASRSIDDDTLNRGSVSHLYGTEKEAVTIDTLLRRNNLTAMLYMSSSANEESFKALSGQYINILHIATHGFCWTDSVARKKDFFVQRGMQAQDNQGSRYVIDPLDRCGLLLAGANTALTGHSKDLPDGVQDGILTAKEISLMDLRDCNLVVLSACETAKGDITNEGVFGLQRAFKMAGVQTIIMSLWKVDDNATQMLMTEFYKNWIEKKQSKREAFRNAQNAVRFAVDEDGDRMYESPEYWAGFIMLD